MQDQKQWMMVQQLKINWQNCRDLYNFLWNLVDQLLIQQQLSLFLQNNYNCDIMIEVQSNIIKSPSTANNPKLSTQHKSDDQTSVSSTSYRDSFVIDENISKKIILKNKDKVLLIDNYHQSREILLSQMVFLQKNNFIYTGANSHFFQITHEELRLAAYCIGLKIKKQRIIYSSEDVEDLKFPVAILDKLGNPQIYEEVACLVQELKKRQQLEDEQMVMEQMERGKLVSTLIGKNGDEIVLWRGILSQHINQITNCTLIKEEQFISTKQILIKLLKVLNLEGFFIIHLDETSQNPILISISPISPVNHNNLILNSILKLNDLSYLQLHSHMLQAALLKHKKQQIKYRIYYDQDGEIGFFAKNFIAQGQIIYREENAMKSIVLTDWIKNQYNKIDWGQLWTKQHNKWKPIKHSCNPNAIVETSYVKAIRNIQKGQEITINFMFFLYHSLQYICKCGSPNCRKVIGFNHQKQQWFRATPQSYLHSWMRDYLFKQTLVRLVNRNCGTIGIEYLSGDCFAVANKDIQIGQAVGDLQQLPIVTFNNRYSITKNQHQFWQTTTNTIQFLNHKCQNFNLYINPNNAAMVARRNISKGEMLCFNYLTTQYDVSFPFVCLCGDKECYGMIKGFKNLNKADQEKIYENGYCSSYVKGEYQRTKS